MFIETSRTSEVVCFQRNRFSRSIFESRQQFCVVSNWSYEEQEPVSFVRIENWGADFLWEILRRWRSNNRRALVRGRFRVTNSIDEVNVALLIFFSCRIWSGDWFWWISFDRSRWATRRIRWSPSIDKISWRFIRLRFKVPLDEIVCFLCGRSVGTMKTRNESMKETFLLRKSKVERAVGCWWTEVGNHRRLKQNRMNYWSREGNGSVWSKFVRWKMKKKILVNRQWESGEKRVSFIVLLFVWRSVNFLLSNRFVLMLIFCRSSDRRFFSLVDDRRVIFDDWQKVRRWTTEKHVFVLTFITRSTDLTQKIADRLWIHFVVALLVRTTRIDGWKVSIERSSRDEFFQFEFQLFDGDRARFVSQNVLKLFDLKKRTDSLWFVEHWPRTNGTSRSELFSQCLNESDGNQDEYRLGESSMFDVEDPLIPNEKQRLDRQTIWTKNKFLLECLENVCRSTTNEHRR